MIGERIRAAREACRLTQDELAESAGISQGSLSDIEAGRVLNPSPDIIEKVATATSYPTRFFSLGPLPDLPEGHYRKLKRGTSKVDRQVRAQVRQVIEIVQRSESELGLPAVSVEPRREVLDLDQVESVANQVRVALGVGTRDPIPNLTRAVERAGVVVIRLPGEMADYDEFSAWPDYGIGGRPIIALTGGHPGDRERFNVGHALGHLVLHTLRSGIESNRAEIEAHRFAAALLLPQEAAREALRAPITLGVLKGVKATFGISIAMTARRALDLQLIGREQYVSLLRQISARKWRLEEPVEVKLENPLLISKIVNSLAGEGSTTERASRLAMPVFTFRALAAS